MKIKYPGTNIIPTNLFVRSRYRIWLLSSMTFDTSTSIQSLRKGLIPFVFEIIAHWNTSPFWWSDQHYSCTFSNGHRESTFGAVARCVPEDVHHLSEPRGEERPRGVRPGSQSDDTRVVCGRWFDVPRDYGASKVEGYRRGDVFETACDRCNVVDWNEIRGDINEMRSMSKILQVVIFAGVDFLVNQFVQSKIIEKTGIIISIEMLCYSDALCV